MTGADNKMCTPRGEVHQLSETLRVSLTKKDLEATQKIIKDFEEKGYYLFFQQTSLREIRTNDDKITEIMKQYQKEKQGYAYLGWMTICPGVDGTDSVPHRALYINKISNYMLENVSGLCIGNAYFWTNYFHEKTGLEKPIDENVYILVVHSRIFKDQTDWLQDQTLKGF